MRASAKAAIACGPRCAIAEYEFPISRITINLAPGDVRKAGPAFDLPIAVGILKATGIVTRTDFTGLVHVGELSLDGSIQPARGVLPIAAEARRNGARALLLPYDNLAEAAVVSGLRLLPVRNLSEAVERLNQADDEWPQAPAPVPVGTAGTRTHPRHLRISPNFMARRSPVAHSKSPPPAVTTC